MTKFIALVLMIAICACATLPVNTPIKTSVSEIYKDPWAYDGKLVRVRGTFNECVSLTCRFCETEEALTSEDYFNKFCMGVSFYDDTELVLYRQKDIAIASSEAHFLMEQLARFTTSTIDAIYSAHCSGSAFDSNVISLCSDRASQLDRAKIVQTHIRRSVSIGAITSYGTELLKNPDAQTTASISLAFQQSRSAFNEDNTNPDFVYLLDEDDEWLDYNISQVGGACICTIDNCRPSDWPKRWGDVAHKTPANPYQCWYAEEVDGVWRFPID